MIITPETPLLRYYKFTSCCDANNVVSFTMSGFFGPLVSEPGTYIYTGPSPYIDSYGEFLIPGRCYYVETPIALASVVLTMFNMPPTTNGGLPGDLLYQSTSVGDGNNSTCLNADSCPDCNSFTTCDVCPDDTVDISYTLVDGECVANNGHISWSFPVASCTCYQLTSCDGSIAPFVSSTPGLAAYVDDFVSLNIGDGQECFFVSIFNSICPGAPDVFISETQTCDCEATCYYISNSGGVITYVSSTNELVTLNIYQIDQWTKICSRTYPITTNATPNIITLGLCPDGTCEPTCFNIPAGDIFYTLNGNSFNVTGPSQFCSSTYPVVTNIPNPVINLLGSCDEGCPRLIYEFVDCITNLVAYVISDSNGTNNYGVPQLSTLIGYTITNYFSEELEFTGCYSIRLGEDQPVEYDHSLTQTMTTVTDCNECIKEYWLLTDCAGNEPDILVMTNMTVYENEVVTLTYCPDICWSVGPAIQSTVELNASVVFVDNTYSICEDCLLDIAPCLCSTIVNLSDAPLALSYYDCNGNLQIIDEVLIPNFRSKKHCVKKWITEVDDETIGGDIIYYGDCLQDVDTLAFTCPVVHEPKRSVKPGYNTPTCTTEQYEDIACRFSELLYKDVLEKRYGISNCCPDELLQIQIKYEVIELAALVDPDYVCTPTNTCGCNTNTGCSCNS